MASGTCGRLDAVHTLGEYKRHGLHLQQLCATSRQEGRSLRADARCGHARGRWGWLIVISRAAGLRNRFRDVASVCAPGPRPISKLVDPNNPANALPNATFARRTDETGTRLDPGTRGRASLRTWPQLNTEQRKEQKSPRSHVATWVIADCRHQKEFLFPRHHLAIFWSRSTD